MHNNHGEKQLQSSMNNYIIVQYKYLRSFFNFFFLFCCFSSFLSLKVFL